MESMSEAVQRSALGASTAMHRLLQSDSEELPDTHTNGGSTSVLYRKGYSIPYCGILLFYLKLETPHIHMRRQNRPMKAFSRIAMASIHLVRVCRTDILRLCIGCPVSDSRLRKHV